MLDAQTTNLLNLRRLAGSRRDAEERLGLLARLQAAGIAAVERIDTVSMVLLHRTAMGDLPAALDVLEQARGVHPDEPTSYSRWSYGLGLLFQLGEWDRAVADLERFRAAWERAGRPQAAFARPDLLWAVAVHGLRGDDAEWGRGIELADAVGTAPDRESWSRRAAAPVVAMAEALIAAARGRPDRGLEILSAPPARMAGSDRGLYAAQRADLAVRCGHPDAAAHLAEAAEVLGENLVAREILARARALRAGDAGALTAPRDALMALGAAYEAARTGVDMGGGAAAEGRAELARLGVAGGPAA